MNRRTNLPPEFGRRLYPLGSLPSVNRLVAEVLALARSAPFPRALMGRARGFSARASDPVVAVFGDGGGKKVLPHRLRPIQLAGSTICGSG